MSWSEVDTSFQILIIALLRVSGGGWLAASISIAILLFIPFRSGALWANWAILAIGLASAIPSFIATLKVKLNTPASPPWIAAVMAIAFLVIGFVLRLIS